MWWTFPDLFRIFSLLSAILHLGNIRYKRKTYRDDSIDICNPEELPVVSELLEVLTHTVVLSGHRSIHWIIMKDLIYRHLSERSGTHYNTCFNTVEINSSVSNIGKIEQRETIKAKTVTLCKILTEGQDEGLKVCFEMRESQYFKSLAEDSPEVQEEELCYEGRILKWMWWLTRSQWSYWITAVMWSVERALVMILTSELWTWRSLWRHMRDATVSAQNGVNICQPLSVYCHTKAPKRCQRVSHLFWTYRVLQPQCTLLFWMTGFLIHDQVKEEMLFEALTTRKTVTVGEKLIVPYKLSEVRLFSI